MNNRNFFIQYHNADKLENFPTGGVDFNLLVSDIRLDDNIQTSPWIYTTKKSVFNSIGGICFLIVGKTENKIKNYYLWCYFEIEQCARKNDGSITVSGIGQDLKRPIFLNNLPNFENLKKFCGNFGIGFQNIDNNPFTQTLNSYTIELKKKDDPNINEKKRLKIVLQELHNKMLLVEPEKRIKEVEKILRKDREIVDLLKKIANYRCQFPHCNSNIPTKKGLNYVEVAHIHPVFTGGQSVLGNLLVLCPNHHKEFDLGKLIILEQNIETISGVLNEISFKINSSKNFL